MPETEKPNSPIHRGLTMGDIVQVFPQTVEVMIDYGLHCFSCHVSVFETLEQGARGHGFSESEIDQMVRDMNAMLTPGLESSPT